MPDFMTNNANELNRPIFTKLKWHQKQVFFLKKNTGVLIVFLVHWLNRVDLRLTKYIVNPNNMKLEDLGPTSQASKNDSYEQSLYWALRNPNVTNIALTGPYGSGKSSVIATFQAKQKQHDYLNISLATFDKSFKEDTEWRQKVELSILQQLIYHVKNRELPDSRFKKISHTTKFEILLVTLGLVLLGICFFNIYKPDFIAKFSWWQHLSAAGKDWVNYISLSYFLFGVSIIIYKFYRTLKSFRFSKLGVTSGQLELADKDDKSIFNKHLDEIIYFFQVTSYDVIVIEDLDRFEDAEIFTKLREVNNLINNSRQVGRPVNFVYAVRDDMFKDTDRAKFFDIIIPIIPIINTSNSGDELNRKLDKMTLEKPILDSFFNTVTVYIQDMRLLINIINEFKIYLTQIGKGLNPEKLLSMVIYKNLYPDEFAKLHKQDGDVYKFINTKKGFIKIHTERLDSEMEAAEKIIADLNRIKLQDIQELKSVYITAIFAQLPNNSVLRVSNVDASIAMLLKDEYFDKMAIQSNFPYRVFKGNNYNLENELLQTSFAQIEQKVHPDNYSIRKAKLMAIADNEIQTQRNLIKDNNRKKAEILGYNIKQVMNSFPDFVLPDGFNDKPLLAFFIGEGYIDEHYPMYISYFIQGSLSQGDMDFVQSLAQRKALGFRHQLTNVTTIVTKWLSIGSYAQPEILNITFFDWVLKADDREAEPRILFEQLASGDERAMQFIDDYIENGQELKKFLSKLAIHYPGYWDKLYDDIRLDDTVMDKHICLLLENVPADLLVNLNGSGKLTNYLDMLDYVEVFEKISNKQNVIDALDKLDIIFLHIEQADSVTAIFDDIYNNNRYHLTPENLKVIFKVFPDLFRPATMDELAVSQYTIIKGSRANDLFSYISSEINIYVKDVLLKIPTNTRESEQSVVELLANTAIEDALKEQFLIQQQIVLPAITAVASDYWNWLLKYSKLKLTWNNLLDYYKMFQSVTDILIIYLNEYPEGKLIKETWQAFFESDDDKEAAAGLELAILNEGQLRLDLYTEIADQSHSRYDDLEIEGLDELKVKALMDSGTFYFTENSLNLINTYFPELVLPFIFNNEEDYLKLDWPLSPDQYVQLIRSDKITADQKLNYLKRLVPDDLTAELAFSLGGFLSSNTAGIGNFTMEFRVALFAKQPSLLETTKLLDRLGRYLNPDGLLNLVASLPHPYNELARTQGKPVYFDWNDLNELLLGYLDRNLKSVISTVTPDEKKGRFRVNFRKEK